MGVGLDLATQRVPYTSSENSFTQKYLTFLRITKNSKNSFTFTFHVKIEILFTFFKTNTIITKMVKNVSGNSEMCDSRYSCTCMAIFW